MEPLSASEILKQAEIYGTHGFPDHSKQGFSCQLYADICVPPLDTLQGVRNTCQRFAQILVAKNIVFKNKSFLG